MEPLGLLSESNDLPRESVIVYLHTDLVCAATSRWPEDGTANGGRSMRNALAFSRTVSRIRHEDSEERIASSNSISFFNEGSVYSVNPVRGHCAQLDWIALSDTALATAWSSFRQITAPADLYFAQRTLINRLMTGAYADRDAAEEAVLGFADSVVQLLAGARPHKIRSRSHRLVENAKTLLARSTKWSLVELAEELNVTVYSLCKTFRAATGTTLGEYRRQLRLRSALDSLRDDGSRDLTGLALDLGFSSHSHFTLAFRRTFGITPSEYRKTL